MKSVLILGASGLLGREVYRIFKESGKYIVLGTAHSRLTRGLLKCDVRNDFELETLIETLKPDILINCIAMRFPDVVEKDPITTAALNVDLPRHLAIMCNNSNTLLIHISTDYVFDGTSCPYHPNDKCNPLNKYGQSKRDSEIAILEVYNNCLIIRVPILYGPGDFGESAVLCLYKSIIEQKEISIDNIAKRVPTYTTDIAKTIYNYVLFDCKIRGIVHVSAEKEYTKYEMALLMGKQLDISTDHIHPMTVENSLVKRPYNCHLDCTELKDAGVLQTTFEVGLHEVFEKAGVI